MTAAKQESLQEFIERQPNLVELFYNDTLPPHSSYRSSLNPAPPEWTNWRDEQRAWRESAVLFDQSHHMPEMFLKGPGTLPLLSHIGINSFANFVPGKAKQLIGCNPKGQVIGECVVYCHGTDEFELVSGVFFQNWIRYHCETGDWDVEYISDPPSNENTKGRTKFRFGMDGPKAETIFREAIESPAPAVPFFNHIKVRIAGCEVVALRHGMAGHKGVELSGRFADYAKVREALFKVGEKHGLRPAGTTTYFSAVAESGWIAYPPPAVYTHADLTEYRKWLPANSWEVKLNLGGSFYSGNIEDYYVTPWDMGYDHLAKFDHDFIGRGALEQSQRKRTAVSLVWDHADIEKIFRSMYEPGIPYKHINYPTVSYSFQQNDQVLDARGNLVGISTNASYTVNERETVSLAIVDRSVAQPGTELVLLWGEPSGGSRKPQVERHRQTEIRVRVERKPFAKTVQTLKNENLSDSETRLPMTDKGAPVAVDQVR